MECPTCGRAVTGLACENCLMTKDYHEIRRLALTADRMSLIDGRHLALLGRGKSLCGLRVPVAPLIAKKRVTVSRDYALQNTRCSACLNAITPMPVEEEEVGADG